jgi:hypothetical protein
MAVPLFLAVAGVTAFCHIFTVFAPYDDEGFLMITVRGYLEGHLLYDSVLTAYGPFYYAYEWVIHSFACFPLTHDSTRILCLLHWLLASALLAWAGGVMTRSVVLAFFIFMQATVHLLNLACEPGHPQEVVVVLLALSACVAAREWKRPWMLPLLGGICAACALTKINVGAFFGLALFLGLACYSSLFQTRRLWFLGLLGFTALLPLALMRPHLGESWARDYSFQVCVSILAAGAVAYVYAETPRLRLRDWLWTGAAFGCVCGIVLGVILLQGSGVRAVVDSLIFMPSKLGSVHCSPVRASGYLWSGAVALGSAALVVYWRNRAGGSGPPLALAKGIYGIVGTLVLVTDATKQLCFLLPWAWLVIVPDAEERGSAIQKTLGRTLICFVAIWQGLQAYPVAGTQVYIATFLLILIFSLCLYDAFQACMRVPWIDQWACRLSPRTSGLLSVLVLAGLLHLFTVEWCKPVARWRAYAPTPSLGLPGARLIHLAKFQTGYYRTLADYLRKQSDTFVVVPGLNSLYFWAGKTPPTYANVTGESIFPPRDRQSQMVEALRKTKRPLILITEQSLREARGSGALAKSPLGGFLKGECQEAGQIQNFRVLAPLSRVERTGISNVPPRTKKQVSLAKLPASG